MNRARFEGELQAQCCREIIARPMPPREVHPGHSHEFDARLLVLVEGERSIVREDGEYTCRGGGPGGAEGVHHRAGRRYLTKAGG